MSLTNRDIASANCAATHIAEDCDSAALWDAQVADERLETGGLIAVGAMIVALDVGLALVHVHGPTPSFAHAAPHIAVPTPHVAAPVGHIGVSTAFQGPVVHTMPSIVHPDVAIKPSLVFSNTVVTP